MKKADYEGHKMKQANILVVEDENIVALSIKNKLEMMGYSVVGTASSGEDALQMLQTEKVDLILLNILMPGMNGWLIHKYLKKQDMTRDIPVIFLSAKSDELSEQFGKTIAEDYIKKPFTNVELSKSVRKSLDNAGLEDVKIVASGGLDEYDIQRLLDKNSPIDVFAVGTKVITSSDRPYLDMAYKLVEYGGKPKFKMSSGKMTFPHKRQVFRFYSSNREMKHDKVIKYGEN